MWALLSGRLSQLERKLDSISPMIWQSSIPLSNIVPRSDHQVYHETSSQDTLPPRIPPSVSTYSPSTLGDTPSLSRSYSPAISNPDVSIQRQSNTSPTRRESTSSYDFGSQGVSQLVSLLSYEEQRRPLPDFSSAYQDWHGDDIIAPVLGFSAGVCPLYPIICTDTIYEMATTASLRGIQQNMESCVVLLTIALHEAYSPLAGSMSGLSEFQKANQIINQLGVRIEMEYVQAQVLSALFMLRKTRILDFWQYLQSACHALYTLIIRLVCLSSVLKGELLIFESAETGPPIKFEVKSRRT